MDITSISVSVAAVLSYLCIIAVLFFERKNYASTLAWILVLLFLPILGIIAYVLFGSGFHIGKHKKYSLKAVYDDLYNHYILKYLKLENNVPLQLTHGSVHSLAEYLFTASDALMTANNTVDLFTDGTELFGTMKEDIRNAKHHIHMLYYIYRDDELGRDILHILEEKARSGVQVRLMYDSLGSILASSKHFKKLLEAGGEVAAFAPVKFSPSMEMRLNYRNHRKITVVDGEVAYVGGMNIGTEYMGLNEKMSPWRDTHLRLRGSAVWMLQERFFMDWCYASDLELQELDLGSYFPEPTVTGTSGVQIVSSGPDNPQSAIKSGILQMIYGAQKYIYLQSPYFTPDASLLEALRIAAYSGVDVRLMIPGIADHWLVQKATLSYAKEALEAGIKVFMYNGFLHAKTVVADGIIATVGTTNLDVRSFYLNFEVNAFVYDKNFAVSCEKTFLNDQINAVELSLDWFAQKGRCTHIMYSLSRLMTPLL